jgi:hypothetical protein
VEKTECKDNSVCAHTPARRSSAAPLRGAGASRGKRVPPESTYNNRVRTIKYKLGFRKSLLYVRGEKTRFGLGNHDKETSLMQFTLP